MGNNGIGQVAAFQHWQSHAEWLGLILVTYLGGSERKVKGTLKSFDLLIRKLWFLLRNATKVGWALASLCSLEKLNKKNDISGAELLCLLHHREYWVWFVRMSVNQGLCFKCFSLYCTTEYGKLVAVPTYSFARIKWAFWSSKECFLTIKAAMQQWEDVDWGQRHAKLDITQPSSNKVELKARLARRERFWSALLT